MTNAQVRQIYPHNVLARSAASALADDRKADRRDEMSPAFASPYGGAVHSMPEQRTLFEQAYMAAEVKRHTYIVGTNMTYSVRGALDDKGEWVYHYYNVQMAWQGYRLALEVHGVVLK